MLRDLDSTLLALLRTAKPGTELAQADVSFDLPDAAWRANLTRLTANLYLYDVRENRGLRTTEPVVEREPDGRITRRPPPVRIDCAYCITAWSTATTDAVLEEHRLLSQVLALLLRTPVLPPSVLRGQLVAQRPPYPTVVAAADPDRSQSEFWHALDQRLKPSLRYVVTLAMSPVEEPAEAGPEVEEVKIRTAQPGETAPGER